MRDPRDAPPLTTRAIRYVDGTVHPDDLAAATRLVLGSEAAVLPAADTSAEDVGLMLAFPKVDRTRSCFAQDGDHEVGLLRLEADQISRSTRVDVHSLPWPGSSDVRGFLLDRGLLVARQHQAEARVPGWKARAAGYDSDPAYLALLRSRGMSAVRRFYRMSILSDSPLVPDVAPSMPDGVEIVTARDEATLRMVHAVRMASFADHWGHVDHAFDEWFAFWSCRPSFDPDDWWLLTVDGTPAAICLLDDRKASLGQGFVDVLGVLREFRGRGLAKLLLRRAFVHYRDLGRSATLLTVDAANATGAVALYEKVGMSADLVRETYELAVG
jgi:mycothiol synthase